MKKRVISIIIAVVLLSTLLSQLSLPAKAAETSGICGDNLTWSFDESTGMLNIIGSGEMMGWNSSSTRPWSTIAQKIKSVLLPDGLTSIGDRAFSNFHDITEIVIPDSVTSIGQYAFNDCNSLKNVMMTNVESVGNYAFTYCSSLAEVTIPDSMITIGDYSFNSCKKLTIVTISNGVLSIGDYAFCDCSSLTNVTIPASVTNIGAGPFVMCNSLTAINVDLDCSNYYSTDGVLFEKKASRLIQYPGGKNGAYQIPDGIRNISDYAFDHCRGLTSVMIPDSVTSIGDNSFDGCRSLKSIVIPNSVNNIGKEAFKMCNDLMSVTLSDNVMSISSSVFKDCSSLTSLTIPDGVTSIGGGAFENCSNLTNVTIPNSVISIGALAFSGCNSLPGMLIPVSVTSIGDGAFENCSNLTTIGVASGNNSYYSIDGVLFGKNPTTLLQYPGGKSGKYQIPDGVTVIRPYAFSFCTSLTSVIIPESVTTIANTAFRYCSSLTDVKIPNSVTTIGDHAFSRCSSLTRVAIPPNVTSISYCLFDHCSSLTTVLIPVSVTSICQNAFNLCRSLTEIYYGGDSSAWDNVDIAVGNDTSNWKMHFNASDPTDIKTYSVIYNSNGGSDAPSAQKKTEDVELILSAESPSKAYMVTFEANGGSITVSSKTVNCTFQSWNTDQNGSGTTYSPGSSYTADADVTLYAQWTNTNLGTLPTPTRSGFCFDGWFTAANGGNMVTNTTVVTGNMTIYAHWTEIPVNTYTITYNANRGTGAPASQMKAHGEALVLSSQTPTKSYTITYNANGGSVTPSSKSVNCTFQGWNTASDGSGTTYQSGASYTVDASVTLFAQWSDPTADILPTPTRENYIFDGWFTEISNGDLVTSSTTITIDITIYAHWTELPSNEHGQCGTNLNWSFDKSTDTLIITGSGAMYNWSIYTDVPWYEYINSIQNVSFPSGLTSIGAFAFSHCNNLESITIPSGVTSIGQYSFEYCGKLLYLLIPNSVVSIGRTAFEYCSNLIDATIGAGVLQIEEGIFRHCESIKSVKILNPNCDIHFSSSSTLGNPRQTLIIGEKGSTAEGYAKKFDYKFVELNKGAIFNDVSINTFYSESVAWAVDRGITTGTSATTFSPDSICTRAQVVTFLWRAAGKPEPKGTDNPFNDIGTNTYYYEAVLWAVENGITTGTSATTFSPNSNCTRAQVVTFLYRASNSPESASSSNPFDDVAQGAYYYDAVLWAVNHSPQITNGTSATTFSPNATCTRGQIVTFLYRSMK